MQSFLVIISVVLGLMQPNQIPQSSLWSPLMTFLVSLIVLAVIIYVAGLIVVGGERTKIIRAFAIVFLGTFMNFLLTMFFSLAPISASLSWESIFLFRLLLSFIIWLSLIKNFYRTGWLGAFAVAVLAVIIMVVLELFLTSFLLALKVFV
jgi:hypothetical protein